MIVYIILKVVLDYPSEFLTSIRGTYYSNGVRSIIFGTNKGFYGPYGSVKVSFTYYAEFNFQICIFDVHDSFILDYLVRRL